jgi:hypothetical protein
MFQKQYTPFISKETRLSTTRASGRLVHFPALFFLALILASAAVISASPYIGPAARDVDNVNGP